MGTWAHYSTRMGVLSEGDHAEVRETGRHEETLYWIGPRVALGLHHRHDPECVPAQVPRRQGHRALQHPIKSSGGSAEPCAHSGTLLKEMLRHPRT